VETHQGHPSLPLSCCRRPGCSEMFTLGWKETSGRGRPGQSMELVSLGMAQSIGEGTHVASALGPSDVGRGGCGVGHQTVSMCNRCSG